MHDNYQVFLSNRVEILYAYFKYSLYKKGVPFAKRLLIVPSPAMKTWLTLRLAEDPDIKVATGFEIYSLEEGLEMARSLTGDPNQEHILPSSLELALRIECELHTIIHTFSTLPQNQQQLWQPLMDYLHVGNTKTLSRKSIRRLTQLSEKLSHHFKQYGRYGAEMITAWERQPEQHWQAFLWHRLFGTSTRWSCPYEVYSRHRPVKPQTPLQCHLFAISYLTILQQKLLYSLADCCAINHYLLSPCALFWSDIRSDKERALINKYRNEEQPLDEMLRDRNPLLANFGRLGREMAKQIEESGGQTAEHYVVAVAVEDHDQYGEHLHDELIKDPDQTKLTLLQAVQADMVLMRNPFDSEPISLDEDSSLQFHVAANRMREVEILYDNIMRIIDSHQNDPQPMTPSDVIVLTPDITEYEPYIKAVFGRRHSQLDCQIMDLKIPAQGHLIQAYLHLLYLPLSHWDAKAILQLFEYPSFQRKQHLSSDHVDTIRDWIKDSGILWGDDVHHRNELLERDHCTEGLIEEGDIGTWNYGLNRLIKSLIFANEKNDEAINLLDEPNVYTSQSAFLGQFIFLLRSLKDDVKPLLDGTALTIENWASYLECLLDTYFAADPQDRLQIEEKETLLKHIHYLRSASHTIQEEKFTFESIKQHLESSLHKEHVCYRENHLQAVKFCSMLPMRAFPSRIVALLGMHEGAYPKRDTNTTLNAMKGAEGVDYCPSQTDYDRYLFLEILLSARDYLLMSYSALSSSDDKERPPSLLVTELLAYLDRSYKVDESKPSEKCLYKHPFHPFDKKYYEDKAFLQSYSMDNYKAAQIYYHAEKPEPFRFIEQFTCDIKNPQLDNIEFCINLNDLSAAIKNPIKTYFNKTLQIYLTSDEDNEMRVEESFTLSALDRYIIQKASLKSPLEHIIPIADSQGILPQGLFKEVAINNLYEKVAPINDFVKSLGITADDFFEIELSDHCLQPERLENGSWIVPAIPVPLQHTTAHLVGKITEITSKGLIVLEEKKLEALIHHLPKYAVLAYLIEHYDLPIELQLIAVKEKSQSIKKELAEHPEHLLKKMVEHYIISLKNPSPLIKEWISDVIAKDPDKLDKTIKDSIDNSYPSFYNEYMKWVVDSQTLPDSQHILDEWGAHAENTFGSTYACWTDKKKDKTTT